MNEHTEPPTTIKEIGIHLVYMSKKLEELDTTLKESSAKFASQKDLSTLEGRVVKLELRNNFKSTLLWVGLVASAIINIIALYNLFTKG